MWIFYFSLIRNTPQCLAPLPQLLSLSVERVKNKAMSGITDRPVITVFLWLNSDLRVWFGLWLNCCINTKTRVFYTLKLFKLFCSCGKQHTATNHISDSEGLGFLDDNCSQLPLIKIAFSLAYRKNIPIECSAIQKPSVNFAIVEMYHSLFLCYVNICRYFLVLCVCIPLCWMSYVTGIQYVTITCLTVSYQKGGQAQFFSLLKRCIFPFFIFNLISSTTCYLYIKNNVHLIIKAWCILFIFTYEGSKCNDISQCGEFCWEGYERGVCTESLMCY